MPVSTFFFFFLQNDVGFQRISVNPATVACAPRDGVNSPNLTDSLRKSRRLSFCTFFSSFSEGSEKSEEDPRPEAIASSRDD